MKKLQVLLGALLFASFQMIFAQSVDCTGSIPGAACDDGQYWYIVGVDGNNVSSPADSYPAILQCDTWSSRGGYDGSNMLTPFMEYWKNSLSNTGTCNLPDAEIRHRTITNLDPGTYKITMRVRCYCEVYNGTSTFKGVKLYANGVNSEDLADESTLTMYGSGAYTLKEAEVTFDVGEDGVLDFGLSINGAGSTEINWVAWKDVKLYRLSLVDGEYYLRNKASKRFVVAGGSWGTQGTLGSTGTPITVKRLDSGMYVLTSIHTNASLNGVGIDYGSGKIYMDYNSTTWNIERTDDGSYIIMSDQGLLGDNGTDELSIDMQDSDDEQTHWEFVTRRMLIEEMLDGESTDATFLIDNANIGVGVQDVGWESDMYAVGGYKDEYSGNHCIEVWNKENFNVFQNLKNIPNGRYRLSVQGYYRYNNNGTNSNIVALETHNDGTEKLYASLYAKSGGNEVSSPLLSIASEVGNISELGLPASNGGMPYSMSEAALAFSAGLYTGCEVIVDVTDHMLVLGVRKEQMDGCDWTIWDNFELTLLELGDNSDFTFDETVKDDIFGEATPENPVDVTSLIQNADFSSTSGWNGNLSLAYASGNTVANMSNRTFDTYQTLTGIPNGWYRVSLKGFYRYGDVQTEQHNGYSYNEESEANNVWAVYTIPYATITRRIGREKLLAELYGNNVKAVLPSIFDYAHENSTHSGDFQTEFGWIPASTQGASEAFSDGEYGVEIMVPVFDQTLKLGVRKLFGYKYDWTCWDDMKLEYLGSDNLVYAESISTDVVSVQMTNGEKRRFSVQVLPATSSDTTLSWTSSNNGVVTVDDYGNATACGVGNAVIYVRANGSKLGSVVKEIQVNVDSGNGDTGALAINEIQVSNIDMFVDPSYNYGGYVELYNSGSKGVRLEGLYVSDDPTNLTKHKLRSKSGAVPAKGFGVIWFDHNSTFSGNVNFKLNMDGGTIYISDAGGNLLLSQTYPAAVTRTSFARMSDGSGVWGVTGYPTPGASNSGSKEIVEAEAIRVVTPVASPSSGFYDMNGLSVNVFGEGDVYFTIDGSVPTESNGIPIEKLPLLNGTTVLRLRAFKEGMLPSEVVTYTYRQSDINHTLPVLMVTADPKDLYSDEMGIFVTGANGVSGSGIDFPCNWNNDWDRAADMEYFDGDGNSVFKQEVNISRFGGWSRSWYPYNFKLKAQKQYEGLNYLEYPFFSGEKPYLKHKVLQVRNGGNDVFSRIKDAALHKIILSSGFYIDCQDYQPVHCYVNGEYMGMLNLREPSNKHFALANYGIDTDEMDQMELTWGVTMKEGTSESFNNWHNLSYSASDESVYEQICEIVDVDEFVNYMAMQLFLGGDDWPGNNCKAFKGHDGKFHVVLFDIDQALRFDGTALTRLSGFRSCPLIDIFFNMMENDKFRKQFVDTYCLIGGSVFEETRSAEIINRMSAEMNPALSIEGLSTSPTAEYMKAVLTYKRCITMMEALYNWRYAQISGEEMYKVKFGANIEDAKLQVNGLDVPTGNFNGALFAPAVLKASAPNGYVFGGWKNGQGIVVSKSENLNLASLAESDFQNGIVVLEAVYERMTTDEQMKNALAMPVKVNEISAGNTVFAGETWKRSDWIELYNPTETDIDVAGLYLSDDADQPLKFQIQKMSSTCSTVIPAGGHLIVWADGVGRDMLHNQIHANFKLGNSDGQQVFVVSSEEFVNNNPNYFAAHPEMKMFIDGITYVAHRGDQTVGRYPDGGKSFYKMWHPTIERTNTLLTSDSYVGEDENYNSLLPNMFSLQLNKGWNWMSHRLQSPIKLDELSNYTERVVGQKSESYRDGSMGMVGNLKELYAGSLYKVKMKQANTFTSDRIFCDSHMPINLQPGWNWVGYPVEGCQTIGDALSGYLAEDGDKIVGQDGFSTFYNGKWTGTLSSFETGKGYMMYTSQAKTFSFGTPAMAINVRRIFKSNLITAKHGVDKYAYPNVMGIVASLCKGEETVLPHQLSLLAYVDGECRGVGQWIDGKIYLTVYGIGGETLEFFAWDEISDTCYTISEHMKFSSGVYGSMASPCVFYIGAADATSIEQVNKDENMPVREIEGYYNLMGTRVSDKSAPMVSGMYIVKYLKGGTRKVYIK